MIKTPYYGGGECVMRLLKSGRYGSFTPDPSGKNLFAFDDSHGNPLRGWDEYDRPVYGYQSINGDFGFGDFFGLLLLGSVICSGGIWL